MKERLFTIALLLCVFALNASSQKAATIKSFVQTTDHISGSDRRNDMNGTPCALVKVQVVDDISRVEGNRIGDIVPMAANIQLIFYRSDTDPGDVLVKILHNEVATSIPDLPPALTKNSDQYYRWPELKAYFEISRFAFSISHVAIQ